MADLSVREYGRILDLAVTLIKEGGPPWEPVCTELMDYFDLRMAGCFEARWPSGATRAVAAWPTWTEQMPWSPQDVAAHPLVRHCAARQDPLPRTVGEVIDEYQWRTSPTYAAARSYFDGALHQFLVPLSQTNGVLRYVGAARPGADFNDRERAYLRRIQPLLRAINSQERELRRIRDTAPRSSEMGLTPRELTVLALLAEGLTAATIGRRLAISPHTVIKHQEHIYRKLGTNDRLTTVLTAQSLGLIVESKP
jgi:DNA-binding CsgD family transcriptional regulator